MILDVFDENFKRIGNFSNHVFAQYEDKLNEAGSFEIQVDATSEVLDLISNGKYVLLDPEVMGEMLYFNDADDGQKLTIKGEHIKRILSFRCINKSQTFFSKTRTQIAQQIVTENFISPTDSLRAVPLLTISTDPKYAPASGTVTFQDSGSCDIVIQNLLDDENMGYTVVPIIGITVNPDTTITNVTRLEFRVLKGADRSRGNTSGNKIVEFSKELKNLYSSTYTKDKTAIKNVAYVAGEGDGVDRVVTSSGDVAKTGLDRVELYVDARDLQSTDEKGNTLSQTDYQNALKQRGRVKLSDCIVSESSESSINLAQPIYEYGVDYFLGDTISSINSKLGVISTLQVTSIIISDTSTGRKLDPQFGTPKISNTKKLKNGGLL